MRGKYPNDPEFEEMDPVLKMFMYAHWIEDQNEKVELLKNHGYLIASFIDPQAVKKIFIAKNRPADHPLIVHISSAQNINEWAEDISPLVPRLAQAFWPGPLTLLLKKKKEHFFPGFP